MDKSFEFRIYPNAKQKNLIETTFAACNWIYNECLDVRKDLYEQYGVTISAYELMKCIPGWKKIHPWLAEADSVALQQCVRHLDAAYNNLFARIAKKEKIGHLRYRNNDRSYQSYRTQNSNGTQIAVIDRHHVKAPKLGSIRCSVSRDIEGRIVSATIKRVATGKYFIVFCCVDCASKDIGCASIDVLGIDAGLHTIITRSDGKKYDNPYFLKKCEKRLKKEQRKLCKKKRGSKNYKKQKRRIATAYEKACNQRKDLIHKATTECIRDANTIVVETLDIAKMKEDEFYLAKLIMDSDMGEAIRQLEYKSDWYKREFIKVPLDFKSTRICSKCGNISDDIGMSQRSWVCPNCGAKHDRDVNAAINIAQKGKTYRGAHGNELRQKPAESD